MERGVQEVGSVVAECNASSSFGAGVRERKVGGVRVALEEHVGGSDGAAVVRVFGYVAEEAAKRFHEVYSGT